MKQKIIRHRDRQEDKRVGSEVGSLRQPNGSPPLCHLEDEGQLGAMG